ncbi:hypothetical protein I6F26_26140 [Ensifer sp. IC3342]|nr:hypothetical protein [Ensifer sp. BRP08]MCA1450040.1 hypothetical protein [Ensifer sp. IC3342]
MDNLPSIGAGHIPRKQTPLSRVSPLHLDREEFVRRYPPLSADAIVDAGVRVLDYARDVGDLRFLDKWLRTELPKHSRFFTDEHRAAITRAEKVLEEWQKIELEFGPGATLNLDHSHFRCLFAQGAGGVQYTDQEIENARRFRSAKLTS